MYNISLSPFWLFSPPQQWGLCETEWNRETVYLGQWWQLKIAAELERRGEETWLVSERSNVWSELESRQRITEIINKRRISIISALFRSLSVLTLPLYLLLDVLVCSHLVSLFTHRLYSSVYSVLTVFSLLSLHWLSPHPLDLPVISQQLPYVPCNTVVFKGTCGIVFAAFPTRMPFIPLLSLHPTRPLFIAHCPANK